MQVNDLFMVAHEKTAGRPRENYNLTRLAAYPVAMNGNPYSELPQVTAHFSRRHEPAKHREGRIPGA